MSDAAPVAYLDLLRCVTCGRPVVPAGDVLRCTDPVCPTVYPYRDGIPVMIDGAKSLFDPWTTSSDRLVGQPRSGIAGRLEGLLKGALPTLMHNPKTAGNYSLFLSHVRRLSPAPRILVVGGRVTGKGMDPILSASALQLIETDVAPGPRVMLICDAHDLPFPDASFDGVIAQAVLEHVLSPERCVSEIHRVLKPGGVVYAEIPFMQQVHEGAYDFTRFSHLGVRYLFRGFAEVQSGPTAGPGTAAGWSLRYLLLSFFRPGRLRSSAQLASRLLFFWLKYLDRFVLDSPGGYDAASGYYFLGTRSDHDLNLKELPPLYRGAG